MSDAILYWNDVALEANRISYTNGMDEETGPTLSSRALAIIHLAMYDACMGAIEASGNSAPFPHYLSAADLPPAANPGASLDAAIAAAAYTTLCDLFPSQKAFFDLIYDEEYLPVGVPNAQAQGGNAYGKAVALALLEKRKNDLGKSDVGYEADTAVGKHRRDPDNPQQGFHAPYYGAGSTLFATTKRYALTAPPVPGTGPGDYRRALRQVRGKGIVPERLDSISPGTRRRTLDETVIGIYWGFDGSPGLGKTSISQTQSQG